jgi:phage terminase large subunit GpA-like protein
MLVEPTVEFAKRFSRHRITSLIENTSVLAERVSDPRERDSGNTILAKEFPGAVLVATGANSSVALRSMPARYLLMDEVYTYPPSASTGAAGTKEGDPVGRPLETLDRRIWGAGAYSSRVQQSMRCSGLCSE